jgi:hypothetical protein
MAFFFVSYTEYTHTQRLNLSKEKCGPLSESSSGGFAGSDKDLSDSTGRSLSFFSSTFHFGHFWTPFPYDSEIQV